MRQERTFGQMKRMVPLPHEATAEGANASFTNGVLRSASGSARSSGASGSRSSSYYFIPRFVVNDPGP